MPDDTRPDETTPPKQGHRWQPGQSGNPSGRPKGSRHEALKALDAIGQENAEALMRKAVELGLAGDTTALRILLDRLSPVPRGRVVRFDLPPIKTAADVNAEARFPKSAG